jgi:hypothetical protein
LRRTFSLAQDFERSQPKKPNSVAQMKSRNADFIDVSICAIGQFHWRTNGAPRICAIDESALREKAGARALRHCCLPLAQQRAQPPAFFLPARFRPMAGNSFRT